MKDHLTRTAGPAGEAVHGATSPPANPPGYELLDEIGRGGMGVVYRASDTTLSRDVAIKILADHYTPDSPAAVRFLSEARITGQLQHPGIPAVHQVGTLPDGRPFLAMKLIKGSTLESLLKNRDNITDRGRWVAVFESVCQAVGYAHAHRVIHRDLKPANVMVGAFGEVQVMDWGLAKVLQEGPASVPEVPAVEVTRAWTEVSPAPELATYTQAGSLVGTPAFISPEQAAGEVGKVDERTDVFGLGALLAVLLTGQPPYLGETFESVRVQAMRGKLDHCFTRLDGCGAEPELVTLCKRCLAFEPADRPRDAVEVAEAVAALRSAAEDRARTAERDKAAADARAQEQRQRRRWQYAAAGLVVVALAAGVIGLAAYLQVQTKANEDLAAKNTELEAATDRERQRFNLAMDAIGLFTGDVSRDVLLKEKEFEGLRTKLLKNAAIFYGKLGAQLKGLDDPASQAAIGRAYHELGDLMDRLGKLPEAIEAYRKALAERKSLAGRPGTGPEAHLDVGRTLVALSSSFLSSHTYQDAAKACREALEAVAKAEALGGKSPASAEVRGDIHLTLARMFLSQDQLTEGEKEVGLGIIARQSVVDARPKDPVALGKLARSYNSLALVTSFKTGIADSWPSLRSAKIFGAQALAADPNNPDRKSEQVLYQSNIARNCLFTDRLTDALAESASALSAIRELVAAYPSVRHFQSQLSFVLYYHGQILLYLDRAGEAEEIFGEMISLNTALAAAGFRAVDAYETTSAAYLHLANHNLNAGKIAKAAAGYRKAIEVTGKLKESDEYLYRHNLTPALRGLGQAEQAAGQPTEAAKLIRQAIAAGEPNKRHWDLYQLGSCHAALSGLAGVAGSGVTTTDGQVHVAKAIELLRQAVKDGFRVRTLLIHDPGYLVLKDQPDFQQVLAEIEALNKAEAPKEK